MRKIMFGTHVLVDLDELADKYTKEEIDNMISTVFVYKGTVATTGDLSSIENPKVGDCWNVEADGNNYAWNGSEWDKLSGTVDLSDYYTKTQVDAIKSALELQIQAVKSLPTGGTTGQVLTKNSDTNGDASWKSLPNSLFIKEHIDSENELPIITQASGIQSSNNYQLSTTVLVNNLNKKTIDLPENLASSINTYKSQYKYYFIFYPSVNGITSIFTNNYNVLGLDSAGNIVGIDNDENSKVLSYSNEDSITESTIIKNMALIDINFSTQSLYFETNIPNITAYAVGHDSFSYQIDVNGEAYYYNKGMPIISTLNGTSYLVTNETPDIQFNYNEIYTVGDYYDLYAIDENSSNWVCYSKSRIPKGGTAGQVLSKNSNTDDDFIWKTLEVNEVTSLWTNSSPTSSLTPGNITLSSSTDDYDSIEFIFTDYIETNNCLSVTVPKGKNVNLSCNLYFAELMHYCSRIITYVNATTYDVKEGYNTSNTDPTSPVLHNDCCILQEIRGHKVIKSS